MGLFNRKNKAEKEPRQRKEFSETGFGKFMGKVGEKIPGLVSDVVQIAGSGTPVKTGLQLITSKLLNIKNDPEASPEDKQAATQLLLEAEQNEREWIQEMYRLEVEDRKDARSMYREKSTMANSVAKFIIRFNLPIIVVLLCIEIYCVFKLKEHPEILALISASVGGITTALLSERQAVINFFFGSSAGSKAKQEHIESNKDLQT